MTLPETNTEKWASRCLLVIEDDPTLNELLAYNLRRAGFKVQQEFDGPRGLQTALQGEAELVLLDLMLPGMGGLEVSRLLKQQKPHLPIIMLTARSDREAELAGFDSGADDYVTKPFDMGVLLARITARLFRHFPQEHQRQESAGLGLALDPDTHVLRTPRAGQKLKLKEYELMTLLLSQPGRLFSREEIVRRVWHDGYVSGSRSLDVHIRRLREKLAALGASACIQTVRGVGFRLAPGEAATDRDCIDEQPETWPDDGGRRRA